MTMFLMPNDVYQAAMAEAIDMIMPGMPGMNMPSSFSTEKVRRILARHCIMQKIMPSDIRNDMIVTSMSGDKLRFNVYTNVIYSYTFPLLSFNE